MAAQLVITQLTKEEGYKWDDFSDESCDQGEPTCFVCYDPCEDADWFLAQ